jgi:hypothetical protein
MVVLINFSNNPFKVQYRDGSKVFVKVIPSNKFVAMKGLRVSEQITNRASLAGDGVTIYDYERGTYVNRNPATPTGATLGFEFVGNNVKPSETVKFNAANSTTLSALTAGYNRLAGLV